MSNEHGRFTSETRIEIPESIRPSAQVLSQYLLPPELYRRPGLPYHGPIHGAETLVLTALSLNAVYEKIRTHSGEEVATKFLTDINADSLLFAAGVHDCGRQGDWGPFRNTEAIDGIIYRGEMAAHGPRGANDLRLQEISLRETTGLSTNQFQRMANLVKLHTPTEQDKRERKLTMLNTQQMLDYDDFQLALLFLQDADEAGLNRGFNARKWNRNRRAPIASGLNSLRTMGIFDGQNYINQRLRLSQVTGLDLSGIAQTLTWMSRHDPEINKEFSQAEREFGKTNPGMGHLNPKRALKAGIKMGALAS